MPMAIMIASGAGAKCIARNTAARKIVSRRCWVTASIASKEGAPLAQGVFDPSVVGRSPGPFGV